MMNPPQRLRILAIEPYFGGSHRDFLEGWQRGSRHELSIEGMKAYKWKWRMRGAALHLAERLADRPVEVDCLVVSDYCNLCDLKALLPPPWRAVPTVAYFHENQLTYPLADESDRDYGYGFINLTTALAAEEVWFNSSYHRQEFLDGAEAILKRLPDYVPHGAVPAVRAKSRVMPLGIDWDGLSKADRRQSDPPLVLWNHRWEYDKGPEAFFNAVTTLTEEGQHFHVAVAGERFRTCPPVFDTVGKRLGDRLVQFGYVSSRAEYVEWLQRADLVVSTAVHEFFGLSVLEAVAAGCFPLLPNRLSYPELLPEGWHRWCLYPDDVELTGRLREAIVSPRPLAPRELSDGVSRFGWATVADRLDRGVEALVDQQRRR